MGDALRGAGLDEPAWRGFLRRWLSLLAVLVALAAWRSEGYYHWDEHWQVLEYTGAALGRTPRSALTWEYPLRLRAWLQPAQYYALGRLLQAGGVEDPSVLAFGFRLFAGVLGLAAVAGLGLASRVWLPAPAAAWVVRALCLLWFVPFFAVRTSSESQSGALLVLGVSVLALARGEGSWSARSLFAAGLLLGLAFETRFAVGVAVAGAVLWLLRVGGIGARVGWLLAGLVPPRLVALLLDRWGYGEWTLPPLHYLEENLVSGRAAAQFGADPLWGYLWLPLRTLFAPFVLLLMAGTVAAWVRRPRHLLTWVSAPFVLAHCLVAHKEERFLLPVVLFTPVLLALAVADLLPWARLRRDRGARLAAGVVLALDLAALLASSLLPARPEVVFQRQVWQAYPDHFAAYLAGGSPWEREGLPLHFYRPRALVLQPLAALFPTRPARALLVADTPDAPRLPGYDCALRFRSLPPWVPRLELLYLDARLGHWALHECRRRP